MEFVVGYCEKVPTSAPRWCYVNFWGVLLFRIVRRALRVCVNKVLCTGYNAPLLQQNICTLFVLALITLRLPAT